MPVQNSHVQPYSTPQAGCQLQTCSNMIDLAPETPCCHASVSKCHAHWQAGPRAAGESSHAGLPSRILRSSLGTPDGLSKTKAWFHPPHSGATLTPPPRRTRRRSPGPVHFLSTCWGGCGRGRLLRIRNGSKHFAHRCGAHSRNTSTVFSIS